MKGHCYEKNNLDEAVPAGWYRFSRSFSKFTLAFLGDLLYTIRCIIVVH